MSQRKTTNGWNQRWLEWRGFVLFIVIMLLFRSAIADWNQVPSGSMIPSILEGDRIVVDKLAYDLRVPFTLTRLATWGDPQRSDVITFESPKDGILLVKRVIGVPGDRVELKDNQLIVNGEPARYTQIPITRLPEPVALNYGRLNVLEESVLGETRTIMTRRTSLRSEHDSFAAIEVPPNQYLVLGDNRDNSRDSRYIGLVDRRLVIGKANTIAFSLDYENYYLPRSERFLKDLL